ncbi:glycosyltransferase family 4 protein [Pseudomonas sp. ZM23]|uniref:Glycosyltransferase family 1 protein n=1 Tax=Pseudomonas triclosanedens TaxID=2961893 RepID=A0ABY6ZZG4_9PSED|nr:glycosyltransferase family 1 protein [Pseudomonas triclosanedens]MCP8466857.1 glycosyltransferase family 4 protein [Pseudomonas triclosanedens]MCP8470081.1 glycosyltransferase family 4 protein [Pseudomonas triclosanedens]MCP8477991.1 glycosyltransferase family 4 protein [Pseudomonas triclosanedens]WAI49405.1 glycosyltransferase family 1 protein [Pseudomonas triclosanedens]
MIVINARFLSQELSGVQRFAEQISLSLARLRSDVHFVAPPGPLVREDVARQLRVERIGRNRGHLWEQVDLPLWLARNGRPLLVSLCNTAPLAYGRQLATHHDIAYVRHPESFSWRFRALYRVLTPLMLRRVLALISVSEFSRQEIASYYRFAKQRIHVIGNAVSGEFRSAAVATPARPYLLAVSSQAAHKNFARMVEAFGLLHDLDVELHIVGSAGRSFADCRLQASGQGERVRWLGRIDDTRLIEEYRGAAAFVFPSLYEGFGIPPLEAQACGCPVIAASSASIPEVLGASALYFDPRDTQALAEAMRRVLLDGELRDSLRRAGLENFLRYSWDLSALRLSSLIDTFLADRADYLPRFDPLE